MLDSGSDQGVVLIAPSATVVLSCKSNDSLCQNHGHQYTKANFTTQINLDHYSLMLYTSRKVLKKNLFFTKHFNHC